MKVLAMMCALVCAIGGTAFAQSNTDTIKVQLDHPVIVNGVELPSGAYTIRILTTGNSNNTALVLRGESGPEASVIVNRLHYLDSKAGNASVRLMRHGSEYLLDEIWLSPYVGFQVMGVEQ
jgi:hypothetical protein